MFFLRSRASDDAPPKPSDHLKAIVGRHMQGADDADASIVGAVAVLLALVAHADRKLEDAEVQEIRRQLARVGGLSGEGVEGVLELLQQHQKALVGEGIHPSTRVLVDLCQHDMRLEVLDVLMDVAAADGRVSMDETNLLRRIAHGLGLSENEYLASQARYRDRLSVLSPRED